MTEIVSHFRIQRLFPHQQDAADQPHRYKASQWGRRGGKSRMAFRVAIMGHGPQVAERTARAKNDDGDFEFRLTALGTPEPQWRGIRHGFDVLWVGRSHEQAKQIWDEEVKPRFREAFGEDSTNDTHKIATFPNGGRLLVCSQDRDSINNARGKGARIIGVIGDEVCHWDNAEGVWLEVLVPMLADNFGWAWFISTTYPGSWFNDLCEKIEGGEKPDWFFSHKTALDNPRISRDAFDAMVAEYDAEDPRLAQEVWAKRTQGGGGLAFPEWNATVHVLPTAWEAPIDWPLVGGLDYGYSSRAAFVLTACGPDGQVFPVWDYVCTERTPYDMGYIVGQSLVDRGKLPEWIVYDEQMAAVTDGAITDAQKWYEGFLAGTAGHRVSFVPSPKGRGSRVAGKRMINELLKHTLGPDGKALPWARPKLRIHPVCRYLLSTLPKLRRDEKHSEDVDTTQDDHGYDALRYILAQRTPRAEQDQPDIPRDIHPGFIPGTSHRRSRARTAEVEAEEELVELAAAGVALGGRYGMRPGRGL